MKSIKRIQIILQNSASNLITPFLSVLFSFIIIKKYNAELWGEFVYYLIIVYLVVHILNWGNKEYLLREFSRNPSSRNDKWIESFFTRILFVPIVLIPYYFISGTYKGSVLMLTLTLLLFIYQSFDVIITFERKFMLTVYIEIVSFIVLALMVFSQTVSDNNILILFIYSVIIKPIILLIYFNKKYFKVNNLRTRINLKYFKYAFPFFILGLTGMLQSKLDIYCVGYFLNKESLGIFQIIVNFLGVFQSVSIFIVAPFVKDIYKLKRESIVKMNNNVFFAGVALLTPFIIVLYIALVFIYKFNLSMDYYIYSALYILPVYYYIVPVYAHYKSGKQNTVILITTIDIALGLISNIFLTPMMGIKGALLSSCISQLIMCGAYYISVSKINAKLSGVTV